MGTFGNTFGLMGAGERSGGIPSFLFQPVVEDRVRVANLIRTFTGTERHVGSGQTYATFTAAYTAASAGDIIVGHGTIDTKNETGAYWLANTTTKRVLVKADPTDGCTIQNTGASTFMFRKRDTVEMVFKDLIFVVNANGKAIYEDTDGDNSICILENCTITNINTGAGAGCYIRADSFPARNRWIEFKNCILSNKSVTTCPITLSVHGANSTFLQTGGSVTTTSCVGFGLATTATGLVSIYDTEFIQNSNTYIFQLGNDTTAPAGDMGLIDIRGCDIKYTGGAYGHAVLMGRGTVQYYFVNNKITCPNISQTPNINMALKTVSTSLANAVMKGNWMIGCRPFALKGAAYNDIQQNVIINNVSTFYPTTFIQTNESGTQLDCVYNKFEKNIIYGISRLVDLDDGGTAGSIRTALLTGNIDNNKYCTNTGFYLNDTSNIAWADRAAFWGNTFDVNSRFYTGVIQP